MCPGGTGCRRLRGEIRGQYSGKSTRPAHNRRSDAQRQHPVNQTAQPTQVRTLHLPHRGGSLECQWFPSPVSAEGHKMTKPHLVPLSHISHTLRRAVVGRSSNRIPGRTWLRAVDVRLGRDVRPREQSFAAVGRSVRASVTAVAERLGVRPRHGSVTAHRGGRAHSRDHRGIS